MKATWTKVYGPPFDPRKQDIRMFERAMENRYQCSFTPPEEIILCGYVATQVWEGRMIENFSGPVKP